MKTFSLGSLPKIRTGWLPALLVSASLATCERLPAQNLRGTPGRSTLGATSLGSSTLGQLGFWRGGRVAHYSSRDMRGGNADLRRIEPGAKLTLVDHRGAGILRRWWTTIAPRNNRAIQRQLIVRCWWDDETEPSVEVPISDFFGMGFGEWRDYQSLPLNMTSGGYNCYWPMPFGRRARIEVENRSKEPVVSFYYNIDIETQPAMPSEGLYFHAQFRRARTVRNQPVTLLEATGRGHYVGTLLSMQPYRGRSLGYLEGDERIFIDGEREPSIIGTGTEDYFNSGWYYDTGVYSAPYHGITIKDEANGRVNTYRWHIEDVIPFTRSLRFDIEHGGVNDAPDVDYTSVAFWYQTHPHAKFPPLPSDLMPIVPAPVPKIAGMIEGEALHTGARATAGELSFQDMTPFSGSWSELGQLWWQQGTAGARLQLSLPAPATGEYNLTGYFTRAPDYGDFRVLVNGQPVGNVVKGYAAGVEPTGPVSFGRVRLQAGANPIAVEITGKQPLSQGHLVGIDGFLLTPATP
ncbi:MAG: hypothetical protein JWN98_1727 [Abditibacteriota bacterium]|nr:hypothetical protein [Abditibacteriota bacterium]